MRVSLFLVVFLLGIMAVLVKGDDGFDQAKWNKGIVELMGHFWVEAYGEHFTPSFSANITRDTRVKLQCNHLRAYVGERIIQSLESSEIICHRNQFSVDAFVQIESELKKNGWDIHWIPKRLTDECGPQSKGFLYVKMK